MGVKIEWKDDTTGKWWARMIFADDLDSTNTTVPYGTPRRCLQSMAMVRFFTQYEKASYYDYEKGFELEHIMLKEITTNHLRQEISFITPQRPSSKLRALQMLPDIEVTQEMLTPVPRSSCDEESREVPERSNAFLTVSFE